MKQILKVLATILIIFIGLVTVAYYGVKPEYAFVAGWLAKAFVDYGEKALNL